MRFVRAVWKLLVGIKDALVLLAMLLFFGALWAGLQAGPKPIGEGVLLVDLDGRWSSSRRGNRRRAWSARGSLPTNIACAMSSPRSMPPPGRPRQGHRARPRKVHRRRAERDRDARRGARPRAQARKPVLAYATGYSDDSYQLAAHASEVWMNPLGAVAIAGPGGNNLYFKGLFDKLGVTANVYRVGTYKAAVEPFTRSDMSPEARANAQALAGAMLETWRDDVGRARPAAARSIDAYLRDPVAMVRAAGGDFARAALARQTDRPRRRAPRVQRPARRAWRERRK